MDAQALDDTLRTLTRRAADWHRLSPAERAALLRGCAQGVADIAEEWVGLACRAKGIDANAPLAGEEWLAGPMTTIRGFRLAAETLESLGAGDSLPLAGGPGGRSIVHVFPRSLLDRLLYFGMRAEVWLEPGAPPSRASAYRHAAGAPPDPGVALVLGAGNVASIGPLDALTMLVTHNQVALLKLNPVNDYLRPVFSRAFSPLIDAGYLQLATGDAESGTYLCHHPLVSRVHLTGSRRTYDAIMWGTDPAEREARMDASTPRLDKPFTAELGCVTPILVVPGPWSEGDLEFQARHVAAMVAHNASFNCVAGKVLVVARDWPLRLSFLEKVERALARTPGRQAYYPGAQQRYDRFLERYPQARPVGESAPGVVPWTVIPDVEPRRGEYALTEEAFCGVLAVCALEGADASAFLAKAVPFVNDSVDGTLSCVLLVHPATRRAEAAAVERAVLDLRYGSVAVNAWSGVVFGIGATTWGAYPGHTPSDAGSGLGVVHNAWLLDHPEKSVLRAPFRIRPTPVWFADHRTLRDVGRHLTALEARPSLRGLLALFAAALRG